MNISKSSWHYRFNAELQSGFPQRSVYTTCTYIRTTLYSAFIGLFALFLALWIGCVAINGLVTPVLLLMGVAVPTTAIVWAFACWGVIGLFVLMALFGLFSDYLTERRYKKEKSLLAQAAEDRNNGICTIVEFV